MSAFLIVRRLLAPCVFAASIHAASDGMKPVRASAGSPAGRMLSTFVPTPVAAALAPETLKGTELRRLEQLPPVAIPIQDAPLGTAVSAVATAAGMNFVAPPAGEFAENVTFSAKVNPWRLLGILGDRYGFTCRFDNGVWLFDRTVVDALESRTYTLKHTNLDVYKAAQNSFNLLSTGTPGAGENGMNAQAGGLVFTPETRKIIDDIQDLLGIARASGRPGGADEARKGGGRVLYLPDANALFVTATPGQHTRVAEYLRVVDRPVRQIRIEARFFETTHDPKLVLGIDPSGAQPGVTLSNLQTQIDLGRVRATPYPDKVLLSADALKLQVNALSTDERSRLVNNPSVVVANNREAYFSVGDEEPFVSANSISPAALDGGFGTTQAHIAIRRIGTSVNLVPTLFPGEPGGPARIRLAVRIEVGVLKGFRHINTVDVPVVSSQKYEYTVFVRPGETLAFGGLSGVAEGETVKKVPLVGDIPVLGYAFKSRDRRKSQRNLVAYLTASVLEEDAAPPAAGGRTGR